MGIIQSERKSIEILRILREHREPVGAKRLSEIMAERGFVLSDRAVQYYLSFLDEQGFTSKIGNKGRVLTPEGHTEIERALVDERVGYVISKLERLAFRSTLDPATGIGDVSYNLSFVHENDLERAEKVFADVIGAGMSFYSNYSVINNDPRIPPDHVGIITVCSITMDGVLQNLGVPVRMAYGGTLQIEGGRAKGFQDLIGYQGTTVDPLSLFINAGLTSIYGAVTKGNGVALANVREISSTAQDQFEEMARNMRELGFVFPVAAGSGVMGLFPVPYRHSIVAFSGMNLIGACVENGITIQSEIGAGNISLSKL